MTCIKSGGQSINKREGEMRITTWSLKVGDHLEIHDGIDGNHPHLKIVELTCDPYEQYGALLVQWKIILSGRRGAAIFDERVSAWYSL